MQVHRDRSLDALAHHLTQQQRIQPDSIAPGPCMLFPTFSAQMPDSPHDQTSSTAFSHAALSINSQPHALQYAVVANVNNAQAHQTAQNSMPGSGLQAGHAAQNLGSTVTEAGEGHGPRKELFELVGRQLAGGLTGVSIICRVVQSCTPL